MEEASRSEAWRQYKVPSYDQQGAAVLIADCIENKHVRQHGGYVHF